MGNRLSVIWVFILLGMSASNFAQQDSIILLNGKVFRGSIDRVEQDIIFYNEFNKRGEQQETNIPTYRVFSYVKDNEETFIYTQDEFKGDYLTVTEAQHTTLGSYDARITCKPRFVFWSSLILGYGISLLDTYYSQAAYDRFVAVNGNPPTKSTVGFFGTAPSMLPFVMPIGLSIGWGIPSFRLKDKQMLQKDLYGNEMYYRGYHRIAKQKRIFAALEGSFIGIASGLVSYAIFKSN